MFREDGTAHARCYWCKGEVEVPIQIQDGTPVAEERFVVNPNRTS